MAIEEKDRIGLLLKYEVDKNYCREVVMVASGQNLKMGTVVGIKSDDTCKIVSVADDETDGSNIVYGVLLEDADASAAVQQGLIVARDAIVIESQLILPDGVTADQKKAILKGLEVRGIVARTTA